MFQKNMKILSSNINNTDLSKDDLKKLKNESVTTASFRKNNESTGKLQSLLRKKVLENL